MGMVTSRAFWMDPEVRPDYQKEPIFDPQYGFTKKRVPRKMIATEEEMDLAMLKPDEKDYCAHLLIKYRACRREKFPLTYFCKPERDALGHCEYEDYVLRMKEFERERRLLERARKNKEEMKATV